MSVRPLINPVVEVSLPAMSGGYVAQRELSLRFGLDLPLGVFVHEILHLYVDGKSPELVLGAGTRLTDYVSRILAQKHRHLQLRDEVLVLGATAHVYELRRDAWFGGEDLTPAAISEVFAAAVDGFYPVSYVDFRDGCRAAARLPESARRAAQFVRWVET